MIYALRNALFLEPPSKSQQEFVKAVEEERSHMTDLEFKMLKLKKRRLATYNPRGSVANEDNEHHTSETLELRTNVKRNRTDTKDQVKFKRNKAKVRIWDENGFSRHLSDISFPLITKFCFRFFQGPNPLSCKKKKTQVNADAASTKVC